MTETNGSDPPVRLNPRLDAALIARVFSAAGRVHIPDVLERASAARIHRALASETPWRAVSFDNGGHREFEVAALAELPEPERREIERRIDAAAARGFAYRYASFRL